MKRGSVPKRLAKWLCNVRGRFSGSRLQRDLYLDLLEKVIVNSIYEDPALAWPGQTESRAFEAKARIHGKDWPSVAHSMVGERRLHNVRKLVQRTLDDGTPGDYIETGVWRGGCCILMRGVLAANAEAKRKVYVADSFAGLPPPRPEEFPVDLGDKLHEATALAVPLTKVRENFSRYGLLDEQVVFIEGFFKDTLPALDTGPFALIRLDGDMYESTIQALEALHPKLSPSGFVIIDDYALKGCSMAVDDYRAAHGITDPMKKIDWTGVWWQKTASGSFQ